MVTNTRLIQDLEALCSLERLQREHFAMTLRVVLSLFLYIPDFVLEINDYSVNYVIY